MNDERLEKAREAIAEADREMARLFAVRMEAVRQIAIYKREKGLPVYDPAQERRVIERGLACVEEESLRGPYEEFIRGVMDVSIRYQEKLLKDVPEETEK